VMLIILYIVYQNDTKIRRKLAYEMYSCVQLLGGFAPQTP